MFFPNLLLVISLMGFLRDFHISCCDTNCTDKPVFTPSRLVVKYGDPTSARCSMCRHCHSSRFGFKVSPGVATIKGTTVIWTVDSLTDFAPAVMCYHKDDNTGEQCCIKLPVTVYKPPDSVSISFDPQMFEGRQVTLSCDVSDVAPVENLVVTFYRGQTRLNQLKHPNAAKRPESGVYNLTITLSEEDDGGQFWCEAKLELGPEGPQPPPVVRSGNITVTVLYKPQLEVASQPDKIFIAEGAPLQLNCTAVGNPRPSYTWTVPPGVSSSSSSSVLFIESVTTADKGEYSCLVKNSMGNVTKVYQVEVTVSHTGLIVAAVVIVLAVIAFIGVVLYIRYYRVNRMGRYVAEIR